jgi:hypothetical protein
LFYLTLVIDKAGDINGSGTEKPESDPQLLGRSSEETQSQKEGQQA